MDNTTAAARKASLEAAAQVCDAAASSTPGIVPLVPGLAWVQGTYRPNTMVPILGMGENGSMYRRMPATQAAAHLRRRAARWAVPAATEEAGPIGAGADAVTDVWTMASLLAQNFSGQHVVALSAHSPGASGGSSLSAAGVPDEEAGFAAWAAQVRGRESADPTGAAAPAGPPGGVEAAPGVPVQSTSAYWAMDWSQQHGRPQTYAEVMARMREFEALEEAQLTAATEEGHEVDVAPRPVAARAAAAPVHSGPASVTSSSSQPLAQAAAAASPSATAARAPRQSANTAPRVRFGGSEFAPMPAARMPVPLKADGVRAVQAPAAAAPAPAPAAQRVSKFKAARLRARK